MAQRVAVVRGDSTLSLESLESGEDMAIEYKMAMDSQLGNKMLSQLNEFRKSGTLCDTKLSLDGKEFAVHKVVLASSSSYFHSLFTMNMRERDQDTIELQCPEAEVCSASWERIDDFLSFLYTSQVVLTKENVESLIVIADYFNVHELKQLGCHFLQDNLNLSNGIALHGFAGKYHCEPLREVTKDFLVGNFSAVSQTEQFLHTSAEQLLEIVSSDELVIFSEEELYEGIVRWVKYNLEARLSYFHDLFAKVRLADVNGRYLAETIAKEPLVKEDPACSEILMQTVLECYVNSTDCPSNSHTSRFVDCVFVNGGRGTDGASASSYIYIPSDGRWFRVPSMRTDRYSHGIAAVCDSVIVVGGYSRTTFTAEVEQFSFKQRGWRSSRPLQQAIKGMAVVAVNGALYLAGGIVENVRRLDVLLKYDPGKDVWETMSPMKVARSGASMIALGNHLYAIGGKAVNNRMLGSVERYSLETDTWEDSIEMRQPRAYAVAAATSAGNILVAGGINEISETVEGDNGILVRTYLQSCEMYNPSAEVWFPVCDLSFQRAFAGVSVLGDHVYIFGGEGTGMRFHSSVECYNSTTNTWEVVSALPVPNKFLQCCPLLLPSGLFRTLECLNQA